MGNEDVYLGAAAAAFVRKKFIEIVFIRAKSALETRRMTGTTKRRNG